MANQFLVKETMTQMKNLLASEIDGLKGDYPIYAGVQLLGYYEKGDTPAPIIYYLAPLAPDPGPDDGGSIIQIGTIKLVHNFVGDVDIRYFGCKIGNFDNKTMLINVSQYCTANKYKTIIIDGAYETSGQFKVPVDTSIDIKGELIYSGTSDETFLEIGDSNSYNFRIKARISVRRKTISSWVSEDSIGVLIHNLYESTEVYINKIQGFTKGFVAKATSKKGFVYNNITFGVIINCRKAVVLTNLNEGYTNENNFVGGRIQQNSTTYPTLSRYGIIITSEDKKYNNNNNKFWKPSIELHSYAGVETIPVLVEYGNYNSFFEVRNEFNQLGTYGDVGMVVRNTSDRNHYIDGFSPLLKTTTASIIEEGINGGSTGERRTMSIFSNNDYSNILKIDDVRSLCCEYNANNTFINKGLFFFTSAGNESDTITGINLNQKAVNLNSTRGIGIKINTHSCKKFLAKVFLASDSPVLDGARFYVKCYDQNDVVVSDSSINLIKGISGLNFTFSPTTNCWSTGVNSLMVPFHVAENIKYIDFIIMGGTGLGGINLESFSISSYDTVTPVIKKYNNSILKAQVKPLLTTYQTGTFVLNSSQSVFGGWIFNGLTWLDILPPASLNTAGILKQCPSSCDIALDPSESYTQSEVKGILTELRDLKSKLRTAGLLET